MKTAIYCRVSTEGQELEGTSLISQEEACIKKAEELDYKVDSDYIFREVYTGLEIDRPQLAKLRQLVFNKGIDAVIAYSLDRLSRNPVHIIILQDGMERAGVELILVTETLDSSDLGKLITHIRGYSAKLEVEKIKERTTRGIFQRVKSGKFPSGHRARLFGYDYIKSEGIRRINKGQSKCVRQIFGWFVSEGLGIDRIAYRLRELGVPTPSGRGLWSASEVWRILRSRAYIGETIISIKGYEPIKLPEATPPIIDIGTFELAQAQLKRNRSKARRNTKQQYLLANHIRCSRCFRKYWGYVKQGEWGGQKHAKRYYRCSGNLQMVSPIRCGNDNLNADKVEALIWREIENVLSNPQLIIAELERRQTEANQRGALEQELCQIVKRLKTLDREQGELLQWALKGFPEEQVVKENEKINNHRANLKEHRAELIARVEQAKQALTDLAKIEGFCELARQNLKSLTFEQKQLALEALQIELWVDGSNINILGAIPISEGYIASTLPGWRETNTPPAFPFCIRASLGGIK